MLRCGAALKNVVAKSVGTECTGSPFRMLFGPRATTRLNGHSVHHGVARYLRNVMCAPVKGRKSENGWNGGKLERRDRGRDRDVRATQRNDKTSARQGPMKMQKEKGRGLTHIRTRNAHRAGRIVYKA